MIKRHVLALSVLLIGGGIMSASLGTYLHEFGMAFRTVVATVISDGLSAQYGTPFTPLNHYSPWTVDEQGVPVETGPDATELDILAHGLFEPARFLDLVVHFTAFDETDTGLIKRIAKPHQYFAVRKAVDSTVRAVDSHGKAGVVWHTQGSGKSMEMELYANLVMTHPRLLNPTLVVITDRTELDGQLYETFARSTLLAESPLQVRRRSELRDQLSNRASGGILFTTLQKFGRTSDERDAGDEHPLLSDRRNIIVIVDEAHRSHYDDLDGYARHLKDALPNATLIAFTGTPISAADHNTRAVFGDYIDIYDLTRAVEDGATVPIYYESRLARIELPDEEKPKVDAEIEELTEDEVNKLNDDLNRLLDMLDERPEIRVTYFVPDKRKSGGSYQTKTGIVRIYDSYTNELVFMDKTRIAVEDMCLVEFVEERGKIQ